MKTSVTKDNWNMIYSIVFQLASVTILIKRLSPTIQQWYMAVIYCNQDLRLCPIPDKKRIITRNLTPQRYRKGCVYISSIVVFGRRLGSNNTEMTRNSHTNCRHKHTLLGFKSSQHLVKICSIGWIAALLWTSIIYWCGMITALQIHPRE